MPIWRHFQLITVIRNNSIILVCSGADYRSLKVQVSGFYSGIHIHTCRFGTIAGKCKTKLNHLFRIFKMSFCFQLELPFLRNFTSDFFVRHGISNFLLIINYLYSKYRLFIAWFLRTIAHFAHWFLCFRRCKSYFFDNISFSLKKIMITYLGYCIGWNALPWLTLTLCRLSHWYRIYILPIKNRDRQSYLIVGYCRFSTKPKRLS